MKIDCKILAIITVLLLFKIQTSLSMDICNAIQNGNKNRVKRVVEEHKNLIHTIINKAYLNNWTPLHVAARKGNLEIVTYLIKNDADPNVKTKKGWTPLHIAADKGHVKTVTYLIKNDADPNAKTKTGWTPLHVAAKKGHVEIVTYLIKNDANPNIKNKTGLTPLHIAAKEGHVKTVAYLIKNGADPNAKTKIGWTPLHFAAKEGQLEVVAHLIKNNGINPNAKTKTGWTPLHSAADKGRLEIVAYLIKDNGIDPNVKTKRGWTPLHFAADKGHVKTVAYLIEHGADIHAKTKTGWTSLHSAADKGQLEIVAYLINNNGINPNIKTKRGRTPLHFAADKGHVETVAYLIENGADIHAKDNWHSTALFEASWRDHWHVVKYFIENNLVDIEIKNSVGNTLCYLASRSKKVDVVKWLLERGASVAKCGWFDFTPLHVAVCPSFISSKNSTSDYNKLQLEIAKILIEHNAAINAKDKYGRTPLHNAVECNLDIVKYCIEKGANVNIADENGNTPLYFAIKTHRHTPGSKLEIVKYLVRQGIYFNKKDINQAIEFKAYKIADYLRKKLPYVINRDISLLKILKNIKNNNLDTARTLINKSDINRAGLLNFLLFRSINNAPPSTIKFLLSEGANPNATNIKNQTPIIKLIQESSLKGKNFEAYKHLLKHGAKKSINHSDYENRDALYYALLKRCKQKVITTLVKNGAQVTKAHKTYIKMLRVKNDYDILLPYNNRFDISYCSICLNDFHETQEISVTPCNHPYDTQCIEGWLLEVGKKNCPICRKHVGFRHKKFFLK